MRMGVKSRTSNNSKLTFANPSVCNVLGRVLVEAFLAVMTVSSGCVVSAVYTYSTTVASRQFEQLHVKHASFGVQVTVAGYRPKKSVC